MELFYETSRIQRMQIFLGFVISVYMTSANIFGTEIFPINIEYFVVCWWQRSMLRYL